MSLDAPGFPPPGTPLLIAPDGTITFIAPPPGPSANLASSAITVNGGAAGATNLFSMWPSGAIGLNGNQSPGNFPGIGVLTPANGGGLRTGFATIGDVPVVVVNGNGVTPPNAIQLAISVGARLRNDGAFAWSSDAAPQSTAADLFLTRAAAATLRLGAADAAAPVSYTLQGQGARAGTDTNTGGASVTHRPGNGTGTGTLSTWKVQTPVAVASGTGAQTMTDTIVCDGGLVTMNQGSSFPASPATNQRYYRTDLKLDCVYDGTRWLTIHEYSLTLPPQNTFVPLSATSTNNFAAPADSTQAGLWVERFIATTYVSTTNSGSHYWTMQLLSGTPTNTTNNVGTAVTTASDSPDLGYSHVIQVGAAMHAGDNAFIVSTTKVGSPGNLYPKCALIYRLIVT